MRPSIRRQLFCDIGRVAPMPKFWGDDKNWTESDEFDWLTAYAEKRPFQALRYCDLILSGMRRWDSTVDVGKLLVNVAAVRDGILLRAEAKVVSITHPMVA
jgi:hypothetical protein